MLKNLSHRTALFTVFVVIFEMASNASSILKDDQRFGGNCASMALRNFSSQLRRMFKTASPRGVLLSLIQSSIDLCQPRKAPVDIVYEHFSGTIGLLAPCLGVVLPTCVRSALPTASATAPKPAPIRSSVVPRLGRAALGVDLGDVLANLLISLSKSVRCHCAM